MYGFYIFVDYQDAAFPAAVKLKQKDKPVTICFCVCCTLSSEE